MNKNDVILMEEGEYKLIRWVPKNPNSYFPLQSYIRHVCVDQYELGWCWWEPEHIHKPCHECGGYPPEGMMAAWKLHNFDWIQKDTR
jgi:hypothetical protein